jgi:ferredoxin-thioredoxin reductase catalytic subunit
MDREKLREVWLKFTEGNDFMLNDDSELVKKIADGVLKNELKYGLKYCPCRIVTDDFEKDIDLICPCNFKIQEKWQNQGECWCGLFVRRRMTK